MVSIRKREKEFPLKWKVAVIPALTIVGVLITIVIFGLYAGVSPLVTIGSFFQGLGSVNGFSEILVRAIPFLLVGLGTAFAFRCGVWNIGGEGQLVIGAIVATWISLGVSLPTPILISLALLLCFFFGGMWAAVAGGLKAKWGINEIIVTIMMNWIAIYFLNWIVRGPLMNPKMAGSIYPFSAVLPSYAILPALIPGMRLHFGLFIALVIAVLSFYILFRTPLGYDIRTIGANPTAARYAGIKVRRGIVIAMFLSGGIIGVAGGMEIIGIHHFLLDEVSAGYGYTGILAGLLGGLHPLGIIPASIFFGVLIVGIEALQRAAMMPFAVIYAIFGIAMLFILIGEFFTRYQIRRG